MTVDVRALDPADFDQWYGAVDRAFGGVPEDPELEQFWRTVIDPARCLAVYEGPTVVGTTQTFALPVSVPGGGFVPTGALSAVSVAATHRRRGILTSMIRRQLDVLREEGVPLAVLTASEPGIYGRYGFGLATQQMSLEIDSSRVRVEVPEGGDDVTLRYAPSFAEAAEACEAVYARSIGTRAGMFLRTPGWERHALIDPPGFRDGGSPAQCVLASRGDGEVVGYVRFHTKPVWDAAGPKGVVTLRDICADDPAVYGALWRFLCDIDLTSTVKAGNRPVDDPLLHLVSDVRRCGVRVRDGLYVRLVDVGSGLSSRSYSSPVDVVFDVSDSFCGWNAGRWRLSGDGKGAVCSRTADRADVALSARDLGAVFLGGVSLSALASAGRVRELREGALTEATTAFATPLAPWLPHGF
ncbi:GNAT family N-acetyltransferase [Streptomyces sp. BPTC-684]|uniref:GNAT family N-acetyltransferase n=1 Tax=Streptomyces sp. BPTC-684 TaxID=3043734 RepID=UPI0024B0D04D|nr:GNAT family N-acetyltransferase [Streptomyces sp. BPTC-684]WHM38730.1 GNAT family N-acetyltransferase [Streptomyces sp. BPTC-684]